MRSVKCDYDNNYIILTHAFIFSMYSIHKYERNELGDFYPTC